MARTDIAVQGGNDAGGDGAAQAERIADGNGPIADARGFTVAELHERQASRLDLQHSQIGQRIAADHARLVLAPVRQCDRDRFDRLVAAFARRNHVVVGNDIAISGDDEAAAQAGRLARDRLTAVLLFLETAEQIFQRIAAGLAGHAAHAADFHLLCGRHVHHRRRQPRRQIGKAARRATGWRNGHGRCHGVLRRLGGRRLRDGNGGQASGQNSDGDKRTNDL